MEGLLVVLPSASRGDQALDPGVVVAGLALLRRVVLAAARAGLLPIVVGYPRREVASILAGTSAILLAPDEAMERVPAGRLVFLPLAVIPQSDWLGALLATPLGAGQLHVDPGTVAVLDADDPGRVLSVASSCRSLDEVVGALRTSFKTEDRAFDERGRFVLAGPRAVRALERWLLENLIKPNEGFMSRHFERRISLALTRRLCKTGVTPNTMTLVSVAIGLVGTAFFLSSAPAYQFSGALLFLIHSILDGCDGELARLKFLESRFGAVLDILGDNLVHTAAFLFMAVGWSLDTRAWWPLALGGIAIFSTLTVATIVHRRGMRASTGDGPPSALSRVADKSVHRDFIYLILLLAAAGKVRWFLVLTAIGAPIFLLLLFWLGRRR